MNTTLTIRHNVWLAAYSVLIHNHSETQSRMLSSEIAVIFSRGRRTDVGAYPVKPDVVNEIRKLLLSKKIGKIKIADKLGVAIATVQRIADELITERRLRTTERKARSG